MSSAQADATHLYYDETIEAYYCCIGTALLPTKIKWENSFGLLLLSGVVLVL